MIVQYLCIASLQSQLINSFFFFWKNVLIDIRPFWAKYHGKLSAEDFVREYDTGIIYIVPIEVFSLR